MFKSRALRVAERRIEDLDWKVKRAEGRYYELEEKYWRLLKHLGLKEMKVPEEVKLESCTSLPPFKGWL